MLLDFTSVVKHSSSKYKNIDSGRNCQIFTVFRVSSSPLPSLLKIQQKELFLINIFRLNGTFVSKYSIIYFSLKIENNNLDPK